MSKEYICVVCYRTNPLEDTDIIRNEWVCKNKKTCQDFMRGPKRHLQEKFFGMIIPTDKKDT